MLEAPVPERFHLRDAPLVQALAQVNFPLLARLDTLAGVAPLQERLIDLFPYMKQQAVPQLQLTMSPTGMLPQASTSTVTEFSDDDGWRLTITAGQATLIATSSYTGVADLVRRLRVVLAALHDDVGVRRCERLGTRFLNVAEVVDGDIWAWTTWFRPELIGWVNPEVLAQQNRLLTTITETRLSRPAPPQVQGEVQSVVRHGYLPAGAVLPMVAPAPLPQSAYLLDLDVFCQAAQKFDPDNLLDQFRDMHGDIERFFYWSLTKDGQAHFGLEADD